MRLALNKGVLYQLLVSLLFALSVYFTSHNLWLSLVSVVIAFLITYCKNSHLWLLLAWAGLNPTLGLFLLVFIVPGFILSYIFKLESFERFLIALPLVALFFVPAYALFLLGVPLSKILLVVLVLLPVLLIGYRNRGRIKQDLLKPIDKQKLIAILFILLVCSVMWGGLFFGKLGRMLEMRYYFASNVMNDRLSAGEIPLWEYRSEMGHPLITFDPPLHYWDVAFLQQFSPWDILHIYQGYSFLLLLFAAFAMMLFSQKVFRLKGLLSAVPGMLFLVSYYAAYMMNYSSQVKEILAIFFIIFAHYLFLKGVENKNFIPFGIVLSALALHHTMFTIGFVLFIIIHAIFLKLKHIKELALGFLVTAGITAFWLIPAFVYRAYTYHPESVPSLLSTLSQTFNSIIGFASTNSEIPVIGVFLVLAALTGGIICKKKKDFVSPWLVFIAAALLLGLIPYLFAVEITRVPLMFLATYIVFLPALIITKWRKIGIVIVLALLLYYGAVSLQMQKEYRHEFFHINHYGMDEPLEFLRNQPMGRVRFMGFSGSVSDNWGTYLTNKSSYTGGHYQPNWKYAYDKALPTQGLEKLHINETYDINKSLIEVRADLNGKPLSEYLEYLKNTGGNYFFIDACKKSARLHTSYMKYINANIIYGQLMPNEEIQEESDCVVVYGIKNISYSNAKFERQAPEKIIFKPPFPDKVVFAEYYFPRWHAYQDDKELDVTPTEYGTISTKPETDNEIVLINKVAGWEAGLAVLSTIVFLLLLFLKPFSSKPF